MLRSRLRAACLGVALCLPSLPAAAQAPALTTEQAQAVRDLVRQTLIDNPEILADAMDALKEKRVAERANAQTQAILSHQNDLIHADDPFLGAKGAAVSVVEFFDYNCGYCRAAFPDILEALKNNTDTRIIIKDLPVLGEGSLTVARLALASRAQGRYTDFHTALMHAKGRLDEATALAIAKDLKLDIKRLQSDAQKPAVSTVIARNHALAEALGISGTPSFVIGSLLIPGKVDATTLGEAIAQARATQGKK
ncbi:MAG: DsbA family protein [Rhodospirillaceae bacterium]|nr:DsbA family protein [Rhodospirillaceae bacterium]